MIIYLIRHALPDFGGEPICIGSRSDLDLSEEGFEQARKLKPALEGIPIYASPLKRAYNTARAASDLEPVVMSGVKEMDVGAFEGLTFGEIKDKFPEAYSKRGSDWSYPPPGGEEYGDAWKRAARALDLIEEDEAAVVAHDGIIRSLLVKFAGADPKADKMPRQPYCGICVLKGGNGSYEFTATGKKADSFPDSGEIEAVRSEFKVGEHICAHMDAVADKACKLAQNLNEKGLNLNIELLNAAAKLHDIARSIGRQHPKAARDYLAERGYLHLGNIIAKHHDLEYDAPIDEAAVLYLADKLICGSEPCTVEQRFAKSRDKCNTDAAKERHRRRYKAALSIEEKIKRIIEG